MKLHIAESVVRQLNEEQYEPMSERYFGSHWLGRDNTYMGYIKSADTDISAEALMNLYGKIIKQRVQTEQDIMLNRDNEMVEPLRKRADFYHRVECYLGSAIYDEAVATQGVEF
jgi:hypothetical protein